MNSLIIFLLHYNLQRLLFDFYSHLMGPVTDLSMPASPYKMWNKPQKCTGCSLGRSLHLPSMYIDYYYTAHKTLPESLSYLFFMAMSIAPLSLSLSLSVSFWLKQSMVFIIIECQRRRCRCRCYPWSFLAAPAAKGVKTLLPAAITIIVFTALWLYVVWLSRRSLKRENGFVFYDLIIMTAFDYKYCGPKSLSLRFFFYVAHWSCKWFWFWFWFGFGFSFEFLFLLMFINETSSFAGNTAFVHSTR